MKMKSQTGHVYVWVLQQYLSGVAGNIWSFYILIQAVSIQVIPLAVPLVVTHRFLDSVIAGPGSHRSFVLGTSHVYPCNSCNLSHYRGDFLILNNSGMYALQTCQGAPQPLQLFEEGSLLQPENSEIHDPLLERCRRVGKGKNLYFREYYWIFQNCSRKKGKE